jgi:hypothetical protein
MANDADKTSSKDGHVGKMEAQLKGWSNRLDELVNGNIAAGAFPRDGYRLRIEEIRERHSAVQVKLNEFAAPGGVDKVWASFRAEIAPDWQALEQAFRDLEPNAHLGARGNADALAAPSAIGRDPKVAPAAERAKPAAVSVGSAGGHSGKK